MRPAYCHCYCGNLLSGPPYTSCIFAARRYASAVYAMALCLCLSQVGVLLKWLNESSCFWQVMMGAFFHLQYPTLCFNRNSGTFKKVYFPLEPWTLKISPWQFDCVVSKTRRRSSLLTKRSTRRGCLLQVS